MLKLNEESQPRAKSAVSLFLFLGVLLLLGCAPRSKESTVAALLKKDTLNAENFEAKAPLYPKSLRPHLRRLFFTNPNNTKRAFTVITGRNEKNEIESIIVKANTNTGWKDFWLSDLKAFKSLKKLEMHRLELKDVETDFPTVEHLVIERCMQTESVLELNERFPKLKELYFYAALPFNIQWSKQNGLENIYITGYTPSQDTLSHYFPAAHTVVVSRVTRGY